MPTSGPNRPDVTAAAILGPVLRREATALRQHEARLHVDETAVHEYRIVARRLRSILVGYEPLLDQAASRHLVSDLRVAGAALSGLRDSQAVLERLEALLDDEAADLDVDLARTQAGRALPPAAGKLASSKLLHSSEYDDFVRRLERFSDLPPWTGLASERVSASMLPILRNEWARFRTRGRAALAALRADGDDGLHEARKAAKRARYVFEAAEPAFGRRARRMAKAASGVQRVLGEQRDSMLTREVLDRAAGESALLGEDTALLNLLLAREAARADELRAQTGESLVALGRKGLSRWMS
ncbi:MAG: CHAD domain-containing protein [Nocardioidaceae bacterium]